MTSTTPRFRSVAIARCARTRTSARSARRSAIGRHGDYFGFSAVAQVNLETAELEQRFRTLSRQFHPTTSTARHQPSGAPASALVVLNDIPYPQAANRAGEYCCSSRVRGQKSRRSHETGPRAAREVFALNESSTRFASGVDPAHRTTSGRRGSNRRAVRSNASARRTKRSSRSCRPAGTRCSTRTPASSNGARCSKPCATACSSATTSTICSPE